MKKKILIDSIYEDKLPQDEMRIYRVTDQNGFGKKIPTDMKLITDQSNRSYRVYEYFVSNYDPYNYLYILVKGIKYKLVDAKDGDGFKIPLQEV